MSRKIWMMDELLRRPDLLEIKKGTVAPNKEMILFHMPLHPESFLAALAAVEGYTNLRESENANAAVHGGVSTEYEVWLHVSQDAHGLDTSFAIDAQKYVIVYEPYTTCPRTTQQWDLEVALDVARAANLACTTKRSLTEGFALLIGADLQTHFPKGLTVSDLKKATPVIMLLEDVRWKGWEELRELLVRNYPQFQIELFSPFSTVLQQFIMMQQSAAVVGVRDAGTYMACCLKRMTIELSFEQYSNWLPKWENPYYSQIHVDDFTLDRVTASFVYKAFSTRAKNCNLESRVVCPT